MVKFTKLDYMILESYKVMVEGIAEYLGDECEVVLHSLENYESSVIKISNGHHTGRKEGAPITDLALQMLQDIKKMPNQNSKAYFTTGKNKKLLKSSTIAITGEDNKIIGLLCINLNLEASFKNFINVFTPNFEEKALPPKNEKFKLSADELVDELIDEEMNNVQMDSSISSVNKNKQIIYNLYDKGIFDFKNAVGKLTEKLNISKNTIYLHLRTYQSK